jgi:hypothetical protein
MRIHRGAEEKASAVVDVTVEALHQQGDFIERHRWPARNVHQHVARIGEQAAAIHQRVAQRTLEGGVRAIVAVGLAETEKATWTVRSQCGGQFIEADVDQTATKEDR